MAVYLLHFSAAVGDITNPRGAARHYVGYTQRPVRERVEQHLRGDGSPLVRAAVQQRIEVTLARTWPEGTRETERALKRRKQSDVYCPICREAALAEAPRTGQRSAPVVIRYGREFGWIAVRDPWRHWHEIPTRDAPDSWRLEARREKERYLAQRRGAPQQ